MKFRLPWMVLVLPCIFGQVISPGLKPPEHLDVPYEPTPRAVLTEMLKAADVGEGDVLYDLGCGDGRVVVAAVKAFGAARAVGIDLDPQRIREANEEAAMAGVTDRVRFIVGDVMEGQYGEATVVFCYLLNKINLQVRPVLLRQLKPGTRIVSHAFHMDDWEPDRTYRHNLARNKLFYKWIVPARAGGRWSWTTRVQESETTFVLNLTQEFQVVRGRIAVGDAQPVSVGKVTINGREIVMDAEIVLSGVRTPVRYEGVIDGDCLMGKQIRGSGDAAVTQDWVAERQKVDPEGVWLLSVDGDIEALEGGILKIWRNEDGVTAAVFGQADSENPVRHFYDWGASVRFDLERSDQEPIVCLGEIQGNTMRGRALLPDSSEVAWTAMRKVF